MAGQVPYAGDHSVRVSAIDEVIVDLLAHLRFEGCDIVLVSESAGGGIVPENAVTLD